MEGFRAQLVKKHGCAFGWIFYFIVQPVLTCIGSHGIVRSRTHQCCKQQQTRNNQPISLPSYLSWLFHRLPCFTPELLRKSTTFVVTSDVK